MRSEGDVSAITSSRSVPRFCTSTPLRRTSSGSRGIATCTRLFSWNTARSTSVPTSKVAVMATVPSEAAFELK
jgi:hypothetical protein